MRQLASIQRITDIQPIEGAERILVASLLGWRVVVAKAENFKVGDLVCYFEVDSILPERPEFEFLRERKFRIKAIKLRKQISMGLVMPLSILPNKNWKEGQDITAILGVTKFDSELEDENKNFQTSKNPVVKWMMRFAWFRKFYNRGKTKGWPSFIVKTDESRIQNFPHICETEANTPLSVTEKADGTSVTFALKKSGKRFEFIVCSRNNRLGKEDNSKYWDMARKYDIENVLHSLIAGVDFIILQGEIIGEGIQGNKYGIHGQEFLAFNLIFPDGRMASERAAELLRDCGIKFVPILITNWKLPATIDDAVMFANAKSVLADTLREGIVCRNAEKGLSFKIINPEFLLKWKL